MSPVAVTEMTTNAVEADTNMDALIEAKVPDEKIAPQGASFDNGTEVSTKPGQVVDYDKNPTNLYTAIEAKDWELVEKIAETNPEDGAVWVCRRERSGKLRWRLLPLHAAIVFKAPEKCVEALLACYPIGAQSKDDQGMLPIHLAFRNGATEGVVNLLLVAYPQSIEVKDRKGRVPLILAQASSSPNKEAFIRALERGPSYYAVASAATERAAVTAEHRSMFDSKVREVQEEHRADLVKLRVARDSERSDLTMKIMELEEELNSSKSLGAVLTDHISALEAQLESRSDAERMLAVKHKAGEEMRKELESKLDGHAEERLLLTGKMTEDQQKIMTLEMDNAAYEKLLDEGSSMVKSIEMSTSQEKDSLEKAKRNLELEAIDLRKKHTEREVLMRTKIQIERNLTTQLSELGVSLAEAKAAKSIAMMEVKERENAMDTERAELTGEINNLSEKLHTVGAQLETMASEQELIVQASACHEETMILASRTQQHLSSEMLRHRDFMDDAVKERVRMAKMIEDQATMIESSANDRLSLSEAMMKQEEDLKSADEQREKIIQAVLKQKRQMQAAAAELCLVLNNRPENNEIEQKSISLPICYEESAIVEVNTPDTNLTEDDGKENENETEEDRYEDKTDEEEQDVDEKYTINDDLEVTTEMCDGADESKTPSFQDI